jgi:hypothetical protein
MIKKTRERAAFSKIVSGFDTSGGTKSTHDHETLGHLIVRPSRCPTGRPASGRLLVSAASTMIVIGYWGYSHQKPITTLL